MKVNSKTVGTGVPHSGSKNLKVSLEVAPFWDVMMRATHLDLLGNLEMRQEVRPCSDLLQLPIALSLLCQRRCVPPPKKAETFRQGRASITQPIVSPSGLLNKDQTHWLCTSRGLLYNRSVFYCCTHSTEDAAQKRGLHFANCTHQCLQRPFNAMHISPLMDDDDWGWALMPVCFTLRDLHTLTHIRTHVLHS